jgi:hypothetical protein
MLARLAPRASRLAGLGDLPIFGHSLGVGHATTAADNCMSR